MVKQNKIHYYIDMDGVLCDHDTQAQKYGVKKEKDENSDTGIAYEISDYPDGFFRTMPRMADFGMFEDYLRGIDKERVHILTAVPKRRCSALSPFDEKRDWIRDNLPFIRSANLHICFREHKQLFATLHPHSILIDDNRNNINEWIRAGGIGVQHLSAQLSIKNAMRIHDSLQFHI